MLDMGHQEKLKKPAVIVVHSDDETLWPELAKLVSGALSLCRQMCSRKKNAFF
jgi:hypothetical protein